MLRPIKYCVFTLLLATAVSANAVPAKPGLHPMTQPDGSVVEVRLIGDEHSHYTLSEDGYLLTEVDHTFYFATIAADGTIEPSAHRAASLAGRSAETRDFLKTVSLDTQTSRLQARDAALAATRLYSRSTSPFRDATRSPQKSLTPGYPMGPGLFPMATFPNYGDQKGLVVLVQYSDVKFHLDDPYDYFSRMLNEPGFSDYGATGSAVDFFRESSGDIFRPQFDVYGPITLSQSMVYYGGNSATGADRNAVQMAIEACQKLDPTVDFTQYDRDGDGVIDNIFIIYAGRGEANGGGSDTVWPHSWEVTSATSTPYFFDGVQLDRYACSNEWMGYRPDGVGTFVHEFSHVMGLPDLYATTYTAGSFTPGGWSAMDYGPYNNNSMTPPLYSAFERYALGWIEPTELSGPMNATLAPIGKNVCGIVNTADPNEFFLFENRQQTSWDTFIPGHGMLIWHVAYDADIWATNAVNNNPTRQRVDLIEADNTQEDTSRAGDSFPGTMGVTSFTAQTTPAFKTWDKTAIDLPITNISELNGMITFKVSGGSDATLAAPVAEAAQEVAATAFKACWKPVEGAGGYVVTLRTVDPASQQPRELLYRFNVGNATSYLFEGLTPETTYEYEVAAGTPLCCSAASNVITVTTSRQPIDCVKPVALSASDVTDNSFTANWEAVPDATDYLIAIFERIPHPSTEEVCDFADGVTHLPEGWSATSTEDYTNAAYTGQASPAMRFSAGGASITSPLFDEPVRSISFWLRGSTASEEADCIALVVKTDFSWIDLATFPVVTTSGGHTYTFDHFPADVRQVRLEYRRKSMRGAVAIDDIRIEWGKPYERIAVEGFELPRHAGDAVALTIDGLKPSTLYSYNVVATDGTLLSIASDFVDLKTADSQSSLGEILSAGSDLYTVDGTTLTALCPLSVYDLAGRLITILPEGSSTSLAAGLYIVRTSGASSKVLLR